MASSLLGRLCKMRNLASKIFTVCGDLRSTSLVNKRLYQEYTGCTENEAKGSSYKTTTVSVLNKDEEGLMIDSYSPIGFRLNNAMRVMGPCAIFPRSIVQWNVGGPQDVNSESLSLFTIMEPKLDILIIGKGDRDAMIDSSVLRLLVTHKINVEILPTDQACTTFNFLNSEGRFVAAALIPPSYVEQYHDDSFEIQSVLDQRDIDEITELNELPERLKDFSDIPGYKSFEEAGESGLKYMRAKIKNTTKGKTPYIGMGKIEHDNKFKDPGGKPKSDAD